MSRPAAYPARSRLGWRWPAWIRGRSRGSAAGPRARLVRARLMQMLSLAGATVCIAIGPIWADDVGPDHVLDVGLLEVGSSEIGTGEIGAQHVGVIQIGAPKVGAGEVGARQVGLAQVAAYQIGPREVDPFEIASGERRLAPEVRDGLPQH